MDEFGFAHRLRKLASPLRGYFWGQPASRDLNAMVVDARDVSVEVVPGQPSLEEGDMSEELRGADSEPRADHDEPVVIEEVVRWH